MKNITSIYCPLHVKLLLWPWLPYFLKIPPPSKCCHIFQPTHLNKCCPQNLAVWYRVDNDIHMHTHNIHAYKQAHYRSCVCTCVLMSVDTTLELSLYQIGPWNKISPWRDFKEIQYAKISTAPNLLLYIAYYINTNYSPTSIILWNSIIPIFIEWNISKMKDSSNNVQNISLSVSRNIHHLHSMLSLCVRVLVKYMSMLKTTN